MSNFEIAPPGSSAYDNPKSISRPKISKSRRKIRLEFSKVSVYRAYNKLRLNNEVETPCSVKMFEFGAKTHRYICKIKC